MPHRKFRAAVPTCNTLPPPPPPLPGAAFVSTCVHLPPPPAAVLLPSCLLLACLVGSAAAQQISTVTDLKQRIYTTMPLGRGAAGDACVRLLTAGGEVGCAAPPGGQPTEGRLLRLEAVRAPEEYPGGCRAQGGGCWAVRPRGCSTAPRGSRLPVVQPPRPPCQLLHPCLPFPTDDAVYVVPPSVLADFLEQCQASPALAARVRGVLSEPSSAPAYSQAAAAPLAGYALYANSSYEWNPTGIACLPRVGRLF